MTSTSTTTTTTATTTFASSPMTDSATPTFDPPGPGVWLRDTDHQTSARSVLVARPFEAGYTSGSRSAFARYGLALERLEGVHVDGWFYFRPVPAGAPDRGAAPPPAPVLTVLTRIIPEFRRRERTARTAIAERRWLADAATWGAERAGWIDRIERSLAADLAGADDDSLAATASDVIGTFSELAHRHFELLGLAVGVGRFLVAAPSFGVTEEQAMAALRGSAPETTGSATLLTELAAIAAGGAPPDSLDALAARSPRARELVDRYLRVYGWRPLGNDADSPTLAEAPDQLLDLIRAAAGRSAATGDGDCADVRAAVPAARRGAFDVLLADARACNGAADDNAGLLGWSLGAVRRVGLEVGRRAVGRGDLAERDDVFLLEPDEFVACAGGRPPVPAGEVRRRRMARAAANAVEPPMFLGGVPSPPPPPSVFPPAMAELARATERFLGRKFTSVVPTARRDATLVADGRTVACGEAVVAGTAGGRIVVCADPDDALARIEPGDILVCPYTTAAWNAVFPLLSGIVTQFGGPLGHTGVMAREFGIPCMVGIGALPHEADGTAGALSVEVGR